MNRSPSNAMSAVPRRSNRAASIFLFCAVSLLSLAGCERWALDEKMAELCAKDGGVKVYLKVQDPKIEFSDTGAPFYRKTSPSISKEDYYGPDYRYVVKEEFLVGKRIKSTASEGELRRLHEAIYRRTDSHLLGESIWYSRGGGDGLTFGFQPSGNACPRPSVDLAKSIFLKGN